MVSSWNIANPDLQINSGDRVLAVNGFRGDSKKLLGELKKEADEFELVVQPRCAVQVGFQVVVEKAIRYEYRETPELNYELQEGSAGVVVGIHEAGHALIDWEGMGDKW